VKGLDRKVKRLAGKNTTQWAGALALASLSCVACSNVRGFFAADSSKDTAKPISNPFGIYDSTTSATDPSESMIFRSKNGSKAVEVEFPRANHGVTDFVIPVPGENASMRSPASVEDDAPSSVSASTYANLAPTQTDRELTREFSKTPFEDEQKRNDIEKGLGLVAADEMTPERRHSYLASIDRVKSLYRNGRYEAGLIEVDSLIRDFPTDPKLHQMRGTLLDRLGHRELAIKSWGQALRFDPKNETLRRYIERHGGRVPAAAKETDAAEVTR
jgi:hypothetical protein